MMRIDLKNSLKPGETFVFNIDWSYNINDRMSVGGRGGYEYFPDDKNYSYTIAQFYPRMVVYDDKEGWQNKQFLGRGEFALNFGDFNLEITVPSDFIVGATGNLENPENVLTKHELIKYNLAKKTYDKPVIIVSPDVGGVVRARAIARRINANLAIIDKRREKAGSSEVMNIIGDVSNHHCILVDDIIDSGGTLCNAAKALMDVGAISVDAYVTHGVLSGSAVSKISNSPLSNLVTTDSITATEAVRMSDSIKQISIAPIIGEAIRRVHMEQSVSSLFE